MGFLFIFRITVDKLDVMTKENQIIAETLEGAKSVLNNESNQLSISMQNSLKILRCPRPSASAPQSRSSSIRKSRADVIGQPQDRRRNSLPLDYFQPHLLPFPGDVPYPHFGSHETFQRVRSFKLTSKGLVNHGDSFRNRNKGKISSSKGSFKNNKRQRLPSDTSTDTESCCSCPNEYYRIAILGAHSVGKTALMNQFMTSEYIGGQDASGNFTLILDVI